RIWSAPTGGLDRLSTLRLRRHALAYAFFTCHAHRGPEDGRYIQSFAVHRSPGCGVRHGAGRTARRPQTDALDLVRLPPAQGLGSSANADYYGLSGLNEARAYLAHPILGQRLRQATEALLAQRPLSARAALGELDALKFRSCMTLFACAEPAEPVFGAALESFFAGEPDPRTLQLLGSETEH